MTRISLIGLGEVGTVLAGDLAQRDAEIAAWDTQFSDPNSKPSLAARTAPLRLAAAAPSAVEGADIIFSAVTAAQTEAAARAAAPGVKAGALYIDLNSASPGAKLAAADAINAAGGAYVEASVMSPIAPKRSASPILLGGPHAERAAGALQPLGFVAAKVFSAMYGKTAAAKLCRSVMVKGMEALLLESMLSARHYGVEDTVLASLTDLFPGIDWPKHTHYMISRALEHGTRRSEEMYEAARTVSEAGLTPLLSEATAARQAWAARFAPALQIQDLSAMLDAINAQTDSDA